MKTTTSPAEEKNLVYSIGADDVTLKNVLWTNGNNQTMLIITIPDQIGKIEKILVEYQKKEEK